MQNHDELWSAHYANRREIVALAAENQSEHHNLARLLNTVAASVARLEIQASALTPATPKEKVT